MKGSLILGNAKVRAEVSLAFRTSNASWASEFQRKSFDFSFSWCKGRTIFAIFHICSTVQYEQRPTILFTSVASFGMGCLLTVEFCFAQDRLGCLHGLQYGPKMVLSAGKTHIWLDWLWDWRPWTFEKLREGIRCFPRLYEKKWCNHAIKALWTSKLGLGVHFPWDSEKCLNCRWGPLPCAAFWIIRIVYWTLYSHNVFHGKLIKSLRHVNCGEVTKTSQSLKKFFDGWYLPKRLDGMLFQLPIVRNKS